MFPIFGSFNEIFLYPNSPTNVDFPNNSDFMHVEENSEHITDKERSNYGHKDDREIIFFDPPSISPSLANYYIDLVVEVADGGKWHYSKNKKPCKI